MVGLKNKYKKYLLSCIPFYGIYYFLFKLDSFYYGLIPDINPFFVFIWAILHAYITYAPIVYFINLMTSI